MRRDREIFALKNFIGIMSDCRRQLVADVLSGNPDLYKYLCADNENLRSLYKKRYELKWLELHWQKCRDLIGKTNLELATRREFLKIFLQHYLDFVAAWNHKPTDAIFFQAQIKSLDKLIQTEQQWTAALSRLETSFIVELKSLQKSIEEVSP